MNTKESECLAECYFCGEKNAKWCKICQGAYCIVDHEEHEESFRQTEYLSWHQYYDLEFLGLFTLQNPLTDYNILIQTLGNKS